MYAQFLSVRGLHAVETLKMVATCCSETSIDIQRTVRQYNPGRLQLILTVKFHEVLLACGSFVTRGRTDRQTWRGCVIRLKSLRRH
jgi:hypothetical protein